MQYIAIFSRYFPSVNWPKILQNFIPGARMLTFSRQNGLFTITSGFFRDKMAYLYYLRFFSPLKCHKRCPIFGTKYLLKGPRLFGSLLICQGLNFQCKFGVNSRHCVPVSKLASPCPKPNSFAHSSMHYVQSQDCSMFLFKTNQSKKFQVKFEDYKRRVTTQT